MLTEIRTARADELSWLRELEDLAGERYVSAGLPGDLEGLSPEVVHAAYEQELLWVIGETSERPLGFALCWQRPRVLHLRELDVHPSRMGQGLGRRLVEYVAAQASERGLDAVTLTTFAEVAWNAPLYRRWGFEQIDTASQPTWLRQIREDEDNGELRQWPRVAMWRSVK